MRDEDAERKDLGFAETVAPDAPGGNEDTLAMDPSVDQDATVDSGNDATVDATGAVYALTIDEELDSVVVGVESDGQVRVMVEIEGDRRSCRYFENDFFISSMVLADGGRLYFGSADGTLHIVE